MGTTSSRSERAAPDRSRQRRPPPVSIDPSAFHFRPLTEPDARRIARWRYPPPYDFYDLPEEAWPDLLGLKRDFQAVDLAPGTVLPGSTPLPDRPRRRWFDLARRTLRSPQLPGPNVIAQDLTVAGFVCFGNEAQISGARDAGLYAQDALDIGLGLRPDLTGQGLGGAFFAACLDHAVRTRQPTALRLAVATFNTRAIAVYRRAGFHTVARCQSPVRGRSVEFVIMVRN